MEKLKIAEQDIVNAVCLSMADQKGLSPADIDVQLMFDEDQYGFSAEIFFNDRVQILAHKDLIAALRFWIQYELNRDPYSGIELVLDEQEGIIAYVN